ncbi:hypothetical protein [Endozoicomonas sp. OPT23]|uniref:lipase family protein n=1 Tax=Endozoicomonas sp. OPT23 TaxID=2072845 RepID=UPI001890D302
MDAQLAAYPYHQSLEKVQNAASSKLDSDNDYSRVGNWGVERDLTSKLAESGGFGTQDKSGLIYDKKTGLTAYVMKNPETQELRLVFGGTTSGKKAGGIGKRMFGNAAFTFRQWVANGKNAVLGKTPDSYQQAKALTNKLLELQSSTPELSSYELKLSGHSKGAGEATYAALARDKPLKAICFGSAQLGRSMQKEIPEENRKDSSLFITHFNIKGDLVPKMGNFRNGLGHLGKVVTLPGEHFWQNPMHRHDRFAHHVDHFANSKR